METKLTLLVTAMVVKPAGLMDGYVRLWRDENESLVLQDQDISIRPVVLPILVVELSHATWQPWSVYVDDQNGGSFFRYSTAL